jgi:CRISPR type III-A-associated protein Csm2
MSAKIKGFDERLEIKPPKDAGEWEEWLNAQNLPEEAIAWLQQFAYYLAKQGGDSNRKELTATQLRKFFGGIKKIHIQVLSKVTQHTVEALAPTPEADKNEQNTNAANKSAAYKKPEPIAVDRNELISLIPQLAYAVARDENKTKLKPFAEWVRNRLQQIENLAQFTNFIKALEAIVAYHKFYEDKRS